MALNSELSKLRRVPFDSQVRKWLVHLPDLIYDGAAIRCLPCDIRLAVSKCSHLKDHVRSKRHIENRKRQCPYGKFLFDLIFMLSACDIPFFVLDKEPFRLFWRKYVSTWKLPHRMEVYRKLPRVREMVENHIKSKVANQKVWVAVDETTDAQKKKVANVLVRVMKSNEPSVPYLIASKRLQKVTAETIEQLVREALSHFGINIHQVLLLVTNTAAYMLKAGGLLKNTFPNLLHLTCMLHVFDLVTEQLRHSHSDVDNLISSTKMVFMKSAKRCQEFRKACLGIPQPPEAIMTRCGTWLEAVFYYYKYFHQVKSLILKFNPTEGPAIEASQYHFGNPQVHNDLYNLYSNYTPLLNAIKQLRNSSLSLSASLDVVDNLSEKLQTLANGPGMRASEMLHSVLNRNPDYDKLRYIDQCIRDGKTSNEYLYFRYANITSLDVERSFSTYTCTFSSRRRCLTETTMETLVMLQMYAHSHPFLCQ